MYCWIAQLNIVCGSPRLKPNIIPLHILSTSRAKYGKLQGWKLLPISRFCGYSQKFSLQNWGLGVFWWYQQAICELKVLFSTNSWKFSLRKFPTYTVYRSASTKGEVHMHLVGTWISDVSMKHIWATPSAEALKSGRNMWQNSHQFPFETATDVFPGSLLGSLYCLPLAIHSLLLHYYHLAPQGNANIKPYVKRTMELSCASGKGLGFNIIGREGNRYRETLSLTFLPVASPTSLRNQILEVLRLCTNIYSGTPL